MQSPIQELSAKTYQIDLIDPANILFGTKESQREVLEKYQLLDLDSTKAFVDTYNQLVDQREKLAQEIAQADDEKSAASPVEKQTQLKRLEAHQRILLTIATSAIQRAEKHALAGVHIRAEELRELIELARIQDPDFVKALLANLAKPQLFSNPLQMQTLQAVLLSVDTRFYQNNIDTLLRISEGLIKQLSDTHYQEQSYHEFIDTVEALRVTWLAIQLGGAQGVDQNRWQQQLDHFKALTKHDYRPISYRAQLVTQSLARVDHDHDPLWKERCLRGYRIITGVVLLAGALKEGSISDAEEAAERILTGIQVNDIKQANWYEAISALEAELGTAVQSEPAFLRFVSKLADLIQSSPRQENLSYGVFELIQRVALNHSLDRNVRLEAINTLQDMYKNKQKWHADIKLGRHGRGNGDENLRDQVLETLFALTQDLQLGGDVLNTLNNLYDTLAAKKNSDAFKRIHKFMPNKDLSQRAPSSALRHMLSRTGVVQTSLGKQLLGSFIDTLPKPAQNIPLPAAAVQAPAAVVEQQAQPNKPGVTPMQANEEKEEKNGSAVAANQIPAVARPAGNIPPQAPQAAAALFQPAQAQPGANAQQIAALEAQLENLEKTREARFAETAYKKLIALKNLEELDKRIKKFKADREECEESGDEFPKDKSTHLQLCIKLVKELPDMDKNIQSIQKEIRKLKGGSQANDISIEHGVLDLSGADIDAAGPVRAGHEDNINLDGGQGLNLSVKSGDIKATGVKIKSGGAVVIGDTLNVGRKN